MVDDFFAFVFDHVYFWSYGHTKARAQKPKQCSRLQLLLRQTLHVLLALVIVVVMVQAHLQVQVMVVVVVQLAATKAAHDSHVEE